MHTLTSTVRNEGEGDQRWFCGGGLHTWKATAEETGGAFLIFEDLLDQGKVTPLHLHADADETFYLLDGEILLDLDGEKQTLAAGGIAVIPRGIPHAFMVTSASARCRERGSRYVGRRVSEKTGPSRAALNCADAPVEQSPASGPTVGSPVVVLPVSA